jgi:maltooligosyltrehalose trehalohydrolase
VTSAFPFLLPLGARPAPEGGVTFRVWAHEAERVSVVLGDERHPLAEHGFGVWSATLPAAHGDRYSYVLGDAEALPDPASRWQPEGLRGPSAVVDPGTFAWTDGGWEGVAPADLVLYELHVGTFTPEGTFDAAIAHLPALAELGVTAIEVMPVAEFPGRHGWGYDGVYLSAAQSSYGGPEAFARLVDAAHAAGLAVVLDVVYNHVGASGGQALEAFGPYFTDKYSTFWGAAINYDDAWSDPVREWVLQSAEGWIRDFHVDGLRLDAIHAIYDGSASPILREIATRVHLADPGALVIAESGMNDPVVTRPPAEGGLGHDAAWADDFHHCLRTLLTGEKEGYYAEFGTIADLVKCFDRPFLHDGTWSSFRAKRFGAPAGDRPVTEFVVFSANHDQVGNRALGDRLAGELRPLAAFATLLSPFVPMLWMGEEYGEPAPFQFFSDHIDEDIATATRDGRRREFASFAAFAGEEVPDPQDPATFERSKLTRETDAALLELHRDLLALRRELPPGDARAEGDEAGRWVRVRRGPYELLMNFAGGPAQVPCGGGAVVVQTHAGVVVEADTATLPPRSGVALRT